MADPFKSLYEFQKEEVESNAKGFGNFAAPTESSSDRANKLVSQLDGQNGFDPRTTGTAINSSSLLTPQRAHNLPSSPIINNPSPPTQTLYNTNPTITSANNYKPPSNYNIRLPGTPVTSTPSVNTGNPNGAYYVIYNPATVGMPSTAPIMYGNPTMNQPATWPGNPAVNYPNTAPVANNNNNGSLLTSVPSVNASSNANRGDLLSSLDPFAHPAPQQQPQQQIQQQHQQQQHQQHQQQHHQQPQNEYRGRPIDDDGSDEDEKRLQKRRR